MRRRGLAVQLTTVVVAAVLVAVAVSFAVAYGLVRQTADREAARTLGRYALLVADGRVATAGGQLASPAGQRVLARVAGVRVVRVHADGRVQGPAQVASALPDDVLREAALGHRVDEQAQVRGRRAFVAARPVPGADDGSVVLVQPRAASQALTRPLRTRLGLALLVGLVVAVALGALLARRLAGPLQRAAAAAGRLGAGDRTVRLPVEGPAEVAAVSASLNALGAALAAGEESSRRFVLSVSHELRTPLTALRGYAEALADGVVGEAELPEVGATLLREAVRLERLVHDLLDLARLDAAEVGAADFRLDPVPTDAAELVRAAAQFWAPRAAAVGVPLTVQAAGPVPLVTDEGRVRQVLDNLVENALRVTPSGAAVVLAARLEGDAAVLEVRDGGPGLREEDLPVAFERGLLHERYRGVRPGGTGLGLALVAGLAQRLGGRAEAGHATEGGALFRVVLPAGPDVPRTLAVRAAHRAG